MDMILAGNGVVAQFHVTGKPRPKGSLVGACLRNPGHTVKMQEQVKDSKAWRTRISNAARVYMFQNDICIPYAKPVTVTLNFYFLRERGVNGDVMPSHATDYPIAPEFGDLEKLERNVMDALVDAKLIADDRQTICMWGTKVFIDPTDIKPGVTIVIMSVSDE